MYVLNRKSKERLQIGDTIITILSNARVKLGIEAPSDVRVVRLGPAAEVSDDVLPSEPPLPKPPIEVADD